VPEPQRPNPELKANAPKRQFELQERSDVDPHQKLNPEVLGEDLGDGFFLDMRPVLVERGPLGNIIKTTPLSEIDRDMFLAGSTDPKIVEARMEAAKPTPAPKSTQSKEMMVELLSGMLMRWYASKQPGQVPYNPLYEGIPASMSMANYKILNPSDAEPLVHVTPAEVHEFLKQVMAKHLEIVNTKTGRKGWKGDIKDLAVRIKR
jgi:hypothetical protein